MALELGTGEIVGRGPEGLGSATDWLPDGRMLITETELVRVEPDRSRVRHADLSHISPSRWSELTVDGRGNAYVNTVNFDIAEFSDVLTSGGAPGKIALVTPDGEAREVADEIAFPNGMVDADGCIWASTAHDANDCARIREGGEVLERIQLDSFCFASMLGGPDRGMLFMLADDWRGPENVDEVVAARTGQVLVPDAPVPGSAGRRPRPT